MDSKKIGLVAFAIIAVIGVSALFFSFKGKEEMKQTVSPTATKNEETTVTTVQAQYKDGVYKQEGDYTSPGGQEKIEVDLTIKSGVVTDASVISEAELPKSKYMQGVFVTNFRPLVIGKNISDLNLGKVAGSSLTPKGFNDALAKIRVLAKM